MHMNLKQTLACIALLLVISGCQSGAGSSSWKWWGVRKKHNRFPRQNWLDLPMTVLRCHRHRFNHQKCLKENLLRRNL